MVGFKPDRTNMAPDPFGRCSDVPRQRESNVGPPVSLSQRSQLQADHRLYEFRSDSRLRHEAPRPIPIFTVIPFRSTAGPRRSFICTAAFTLLALSILVGIHPVYAGLPSCIDFCSGCNDPAGCVVQYGCAASPNSSQKCTCGTESAVLTLQQPPGRPDAHQVRGVNGTIVEPVAVRRPTPNHVTGPGSQKKVLRDAEEDCASWCLNVSGSLCGQVAPGPERINCLIRCACAGGY